MQVLNRGTVRRDRFVAGNARRSLALAWHASVGILTQSSTVQYFDARAEERIEGLIARLARRYTVVAVSHGLAQAVRIADRAVVLRGGAIAQVLERSQLTDADGLRALVDEAF